MSRALLISLLASSQLAASVPLCSRAELPPTSTANGLQLYVHVTSHDLSPSLEGSTVSGIHVGAGQNTAVISKAPWQGGNSTWSFWLNGTNAEVASGQTQLVADGGTFPFNFPWGITVQPPNSSVPETYVGVDAGTGTPGVGPSTGGAGGKASYVRIVNQPSGTWVACNRFVPYYQANYTQLLFVYNGAAVPADCASLRLIPRCSTVPDLQEGGQYTHDYLHNVQCYQKPEEIKWASYD